MGAWDTYKNNYKGKTDVKARKEGYATQDTTSKGEDVVKRKLVQSYSYSISVIDAKDTIQRLKNFNDNMKHLRVCKRDKNGKLTLPQTVSEAEGLEEFKEVNNLDELIKYMYKTTEDGTYYLYVLKYMDDDDSEFKGKIIYEREDGTEKTLFEDSAIRIWDLFTKRDY